MPSTPPQPLELARALKAADPDRYLTVVAAPPAPDRLAPLLGLYLLNAELARTGEVAREAMVADIRLKWWYDALGSAAEAGSHAQPALDALAPSLGQGEPPLAEVQALVEARQPEQDPMPFPDLDAFVAHAGAGGGRLAALAARLLGAGEAERSAAASAGTAHALMGLLRAAPAHAARGRLLLPADLCSAADVGLQSLAAGCGGAALRPLSEAIAARAMLSLQEARHLQPRLPKGRAAPLLLATLAEQALARLRKGGGDPLSPPFQQAPPGRAWRLLARRIGGRT